MAATDLMSLVYDRVFFAPQARGAQLLGGPGV